MKKLTAFAFVLALAALVPVTGVSATGPNPVEDPDGFDQACVRVYCDGEYAGLACGPTVDDLIDGAETLCGGGANQQ